MLSLSAKIRKEVGKKVKALRKKGVLPGVLYGPKIKTAQPLELDEKEFEKVYQEAGESSLISLEVAEKKYPVLIHEVDRDPLAGKPIHIDFYQPRLDEEVEVTIPIIFEGFSPAVKDLGGTLVKNIQEVEVKALPQNLLHEIKVNVEKLKTFEDNILIKDLILPREVKIIRDLEEIVAQVSPQAKVEEELARPIEEKVEEVETTTRPPRPPAKGGPLVEEKKEKEEEEMEK